jgi:hypothetical protein
MESKNILQQASPGYSNFRPEFFKTDFDQAVWAKGYDMLLEKAMRCPCNGTEAPLIDCQNCSGTGYFYVSPIKTKGLTTNINQNNQYHPWSEQLLGTIAITVMDADKPNLSYFDRISFLTEYSYYSENVKIRENDGVYFVFTTYRVVELLAIYIFQASDKKLIKTLNAHTSDDNPYCLILDLAEIPENGFISVYYKHCPEYHVLDLPHEIRASWNTERKSGKQYKIELPIQAIARRSHLIAIEKPNFDGTGVIIND